MQYPLSIVFIYVRYRMRAYIMTVEQALEEYNMKKLSAKNIIAAALIIALGLAAYYCHYTGILQTCTAEGIKEYVNSFGICGPIVYMIMFSVIPSGSIIAIAGGMAFGMYLGTLYTTLGALLGSTTAFYIARFLGREAVEKILKGKMQSFDDGIEERGFLIILILRLIPIIPFNVVSYGAGLTKVKFLDYILATMIGIIPGVIVFTNLGDKALNINSPEFLQALLLFAALIAASLVLKKKVSISKINNKTSLKHPKA
jgi:uncharacterized membrane protein YdjX (TVP38/TMEM64 family)